MFEDQTQELIINRMLQKVDGSLDKREGSIIFDMLSPASIEVAQAYIQLDSVLNFGFADTTYGDYLDMRAGEVGLIRKGTVKATGKLTFTGPDNTIIPAGTQVSNGDSSNTIIAQTLINTTIVSGSITIDAEALVGGISGNLLVGGYNTILGSIAGGLVSVKNNEAFEGGYDTESDSDLLARYKIRTQNIVASGNDTYYKLLATEIPGVYDARIYPRWNGNGSVKVVVLSPNKKSPSQSVINQVIDNINNNLMLGVDVTVEGVEEITIDIDVTLTLQTGAAVPYDDIANNISDYLASIAFNDLVVRYSRIGDRFLDVGPVIDYENLMINGMTSNITVEDYQVAVLGRLTITTN